MSTADDSDKVWNNNKLYKKNDENDHMDSWIEFKKSVESMDLKKDILDKDEWKTHKKTLSLKKSLILEKEKKNTCTFCKEFKLYVKKVDKDRISTCRRNSAHSNLIEVDDLMKSKNKNKRRNKIKSMLFDSNLNQNSSIKDESRITENPIMGQDYMHEKGYLEGLFGNKNVLFNIDNIKYTLCKIQIEHLAEQMCIIDCELLKHISWEEIHDGAWISNDKYKMASNVLNCISHFNRISTLVAMNILFNKKPIQRKKAISYFINLAKELYKLKNFNSLYAVLSALTMQPIYRLQETWNIISEDVIREYKELDDVMAPINNFFVYRNEVGNCILKDLGFIPFLGVFLSDVNSAISYKKVKNNTSKEEVKTSLESKKQRKASLKIKPVKDDSPDFRLSRCTRSVQGDLRINYVNNEFFERISKIRIQYHQNAESNNRIFSCTSIDETSQDKESYKEDNKKEISIIGTSESDINNEKKINQPFLNDCEKFLEIFKNYSLKYNNIEGCELLITYLFHIPISTEKELDERSYRLEK